MTEKNDIQTCIVHLVGAGPGDPGWITVRGLELVRTADVIVFDALANPLLLREARSDAELIDVGKRARDHKLPQDQINDLLVEKAKQGMRVVRLKGGDPYLFGRGAEEAAYLATHGVKVEVVPGITSGIAAPMAAGIPVTHRKHASTVTLVTGHEDPTKSESSVNYGALAGLIAAGGTVCFYMGVGRLGAISETLQAKGLRVDMPVAVVQWGGMPQQRSVRGTLGSIVDDVQRTGIDSPAIIIVGSVAGIDESGLDYFTQRSLFGQRMIVTRTRQQASDLSLLLSDRGAAVLEAPTIELAEPTADAWANVDTAIRDITRYDWLVLTSANGVAALRARLSKLGLDARAFAGVKLAAIGEVTAEVMRRDLGLTPDLVPTRYVAESLAADLIAQHAVKGKRFLLLRADIARPAIPRLLTEAGAVVEDLTIYETRPAASLPDDVLAALREQKVDWITFTSSSTAKNMVELLGDERELLQHVRIASIGPITSDTVRELGLTVAVEATSSTIPGLVAAIESAMRPADV